MSRTPRIRNPEKRAAFAAVKQAVSQAVVSTALALTIPEPARSWAPVANYRDIRPADIRTPEFATWPEGSRRMVWRGPTFYSRSR